MAAAAVFGEDVRKSRRSFPNTTADLGPLKVILRDRDDEGCIAILSR
jgi:hypothetical protein